MEEPEPEPSGEPLAFQVLYGAREGEPMSYLLKVSFCSIDHARSPMIWITMLQSKAQATGKVSI
jgi:hypothetical protein